MAEKFKKIEKEFVLSDSSVNVYSFRLLTSGYLLDEYLKNPIGYYMHDRDNGVLLRWDDMRIEGDRILGKPVVNLSHPRGQQTADEIESGFLNAASFGELVVLDSREDVDPLNPASTILTVTKWYNKECSLVDMPGNRNAFAVKLFDKNNQEINLADLTNISKPTMKKVTLTITPALVAHLGLSDSGINAEEKDITAAIQNLADKAAKVPRLELEKSQAENRAQTAETQLANLQDSTTKSKVKDLLDKALAGKKITKDLSDTLSADYANNPTGLEKLLNGMTAYKSVVDNLSDKGDKVALRVKNLSDKSWNELDKAGELPELKKLSPEAYSEKFEEKWGRKP